MLNLLKSGSGSGVQAALAQTTTSDVTYISPCCCSEYRGTGAVPLGEFIDTPAVPEPGGMVLFGLGSAWVVVCLRRRGAVLWSGGDDKVNPPDITVLTHRSMKPNTRLYRDGAGGSGPIGANGSYGV